METKLLYQPFDKIEADAVAVVLFEDDAAPAELKFAAAWLDELKTSGEFSGKTDETAVLHQPQGLKAKRLVAVGGGKRESFDLRKAVAAVTRAVKQKGVKTLAWWLNGLDPEAAVEGSILGNFEPDQYKTANQGKSLDAFHVVSPTNGAELDKAFERGRILAESQNFTRALVNEPANRLTPTLLADRACAMAAESGLECEVLDQDRMKQLGMGALLGVAQGSAEPPALVIVRYKPATAPKSGDHLALIGKGVTFDTGGVSIKPADGMEKMKYDMAGGATMIGVMRAIALLKPKRKITAIICATENMPSGKAQKPGDVQIAMSGKSIEIINTDAEGRLVLADGLFYARQLGCTHLIDAATLTGAVVVALGYVNAGIFANDESMYDGFSRALAKAGEKMWRLPLDDEYKEVIKSNIADIVNSGGRWGGSITAAMFLKEFAEDTPWIHLDIAGTAWTEEAKPWIAKGPSGIAVRALVEFAKEFAG